MVKKKLELMLFVSSDNDNQISKEFVILLGLDPEDNELQKFFSENKITLNPNLWNGFKMGDKLSQEQEYILVIKAKEGDTQSLNALIECFYGFVKRMAENFFFKSSVLYNGSFDCDDLTQEGILGIRKAVMSFDIYKKNRFSTYVRNWVKASFNQIIYGTDTMKIPRNRKNELVRLRKAYDECYTMGYEPTFERLADMVNLPVSHVRKLYGYLNMLTVQSLNDMLNPYSSDSDATKLDMVFACSNWNDDKNIPNEYNSSVEEYVAHCNKYDELYKAIDTLSKAEKDILYLRFGFNGDKPLTIEQLAEKYNSTPYKMYKYINTIINKIKNELAKNIDAI